MSNPFWNHCHLPGEILACGYEECCSSKICNNGTSNSCSSDDSKHPSATVNYTYYDPKCLEFHGECPLAVSLLPPYLTGSPIGCCKNESRQCTNCSQVETNQSYLLEVTTKPEVPSATYLLPPSIASTVSSPGVSGKATDTPGEPGSEPAAQTTAILQSVLPTATTASKPVSPTNRAAPKPNTAAVAGGIAGGIIGLALLLAVLAIYYRRRPTRPLKNTDQGKLPTWGAGQARAIGGGGGELEELKQGPSPTSSLLRPPSSWPLPQPPSYTPYRSHDNELDKSPPNDPQPVASPPHPSNNHPSPESPPSPPPSNTRSSQYSADHDSEAESVSPISSHYQRHPFDEEGGVKASVYSDISSNDLFQNQNMRS